MRPRPRLDLTLFCTEDAAWSAPFRVIALF